MFIAIVVTAPVLSRAGVVLAHQPLKTAKLTIENFINAPWCDRFPAKYWTQYCPQGEKRGLTTITIFNETMKTPAVQFPVGPWGVKTEKVFKIPIGSFYKISTRVPEPNYIACCPKEAPKAGYIFYYIDSFIGPQKNGCKAGPGVNIECTARMEADGAYIHVGYYWNYHV